MPQNYYTMFYVMTEICFTELSPKGKTKMHDDTLKEVSKDEIPQVLEELKKDWPTNFLVSTVGLHKIHIP